MLDFISQKTSDGLHLPDGTILRSLEAQVQKNKEDIANHYNIDRVLADFGIRVIGQVVSSTELPDPETFDGEYGDAYAVGSEAPYQFYIWTRADKDAGRYADYWMPIGPLAIVGPQGPIGKTPIISNNGTNITSTDPTTGETTNVIPIHEIRGSNWYAGTAIPSNIAGSKENDMYLNTQTGMVYQYRDAHWYPIRSIKGSQGIQGLTGPAPELYKEGGYIFAKDPQTGKTKEVVSLADITGPTGQTGKPGSIYRVVATIPEVGYLPAPNDVGPNEAYLVGHQNAYYIYVAINDKWYNLGNVSFSLPMGSNIFLAYDQFGNPIGANLYHVSVICRNFDYDSKTGLVNGCLTLNIPNTYTFSGRGSLYNWLLQHGYTNAANSFYPASGFSFDENRKYTYIGIAANPNIYGALLFVGFREDRVEGGELKQASFNYHETDGSKTNYIPQMYYDASIIPPSGTI
jgi:hypothetical protein